MMLKMTKKAVLETLAEKKIETELHMEKKDTEAVRNPGAAGISGFHKVRTLVRFNISQGTFSDLEVIELAG